MEDSLQPSPVPERQQCHEVTHRGGKDNAGSRGAASVAVPHPGPDRSCIQGRYPGSRLRSSGDFTRCPRCTAFPGAGPSGVYVHLVCLPLRGQRRHCERGSRTCFPFNLPRDSTSGTLNTDPPKRNRGGRYHHRPEKPNRKAGSIRPETGRQPCTAMPAPHSASMSISAVMQSASRSMLCSRSACRSSACGAASPAQRSSAAQACGASNRPCT